MVIKMKKISYILLIISYLVLAKNKGNKCFPPWKCSCDNIEPPTIGKSAFAPIK